MPRPIEAGNENVGVNDRMAEKQDRQPFRARRLHIVEFLNAMLIYSAREILFPYRQERDTDGALLGFNRELCGLN